jgi:hypothetical protein
MTFIPDQSKHSVQEVPFYDDVTAEAGWQGQSTSKSIETLKAEIMTALGRLGGLVTGFQRGSYVIGDKKREGFQIHYVVETPDGAMHRGRLDVAALPVRDNYSYRRSVDSRKEKSLKMALYMLRKALNGTWFLQQLSPGYAPLMPWMLAKGDKTVTQLWSESVFVSNLLPSGEEFVDAKIIP